MFSVVNKHLRPYLPQCIIGPIFKLIEAVLELILPMLMASLIDRGVSTGDNGYILRIGGIMAITATTGLLSALVCQYLASYTSQGFGTSLRSAMFKKINSLDARTLDRYGAITFTNRLTNDVNQLQQAVAMLIRLVIRAPFICIGSIVAAMLIDIKLAVITLIAVALFSAMLTVIIKKLGPLYMKIQKRLDSLGRVINENLSGVRVIRAFAKADREKIRFEGANEDWTRDTVRAGRLATLVSPVTMLIINLSVTAIVWFGGIRVNGGGMTQGELIAFINYMTQVLNTLIVVSNLVQLYTKAYASLGRVNEIMRLPESDAGENTFDEPDFSAPAVEFAGVTFRYGDGETPELANVSFTLRRGETLGVIGGTGSGKSTLVNLIPALYTTFTGNVRVFGGSVKEYSRSALRGLIGFVPQSAQLFSGTVEENIAFGAKLCEDDIYTAIDSSASDFVRSLDGGISARVERGGRNFSGGQKQRLTIARAVARKPQILILDDAMSAVDYATELKLRRAVRRLTKENGTSAIIVTQRISSIAYADKILVLDDGRVAGLGTHDELMAGCAEYRDIALSQQSGGEAQ